MNETIDYYNRNAEQFTLKTVNVDFTEIQNKFLGFLPEKATILDFGCGAGRDTKYFLECGYVVEAIDGSEELCKIANQNTGTSVKHMFFQELNEKNRYDGIWACSSILHLPKRELVDVFKKMLITLKDNSIMYTSFKYGDFEGDRNGRFFTDFTEYSFLEFIEKVKGISVEEYWITGDVREDRGEEKWLNIILRKQNIR